MKTLERRSLGQEFWAQNIAEKKARDYLSSIGLPACTAFPKGGDMACQKYSALMHELTEINLCLKNLDGTPQCTNQSHQADETVRN